ESLPVELMTPDVMNHLRNAAMRSAVLISISIAGQRVCALALQAARGDRIWPPPLITRLRFLGEILAGSLERSRRAEALRPDCVEVERVPATQAEEPGSTVERAPAQPDLDTIIGES